MVVIYNNQILCVDLDWILSGYTATKALMKGVGNFNTTVCYVMLLN